jgi:hypothetical protein
MNMRVGDAKAIRPEEEKAQQKLADFPILASERPRVLVVEPPHA